MAEMTAGMVRELREKTDAPMMECKKALTEAGGDLAKAEEILRIKLGNKATKGRRRASPPRAWSRRTSPRTASSARIVEVNCETDFVARERGIPCVRRGAGRLVAEQAPARCRRAVAAHA